MSILQKLSYQLMRRYHQGVIAWNHYIYYPSKKLYDNALGGSIITVNEITDWHCRPIFNYNVFQILYFVFLCILQNVKNRYWIISVFPAPRCKDVIYEIVCWDNKKFLTRSSFSIQSRRTFNTRNTVLYAYMNNIDVTNFINSYAASFTLDHNFTLFDLLPIMYLKGYLTMRQIVEVVRNEPTLNVMDAHTLNEITFKDNHPLIL